MTDKRTSLLVKYFLADFCRTRNQKFLVQWLDPSSKKVCQLKYKAYAEVKVFLPKITQFYELSQKYLQLNLQPA
jgi:hypothetical protein